MARKNIAWYEFRLRPEHKEKRVGESQTVPDETLTIQEIMKKHVRGQRIADELMRTPVYDSGLSDYGDSESDFGMEDLSKVEGLDIAEKDEIRESYKQKIEEYKEKEKSFLKKKKEVLLQVNGKKGFLTVKCLLCLQIILLWLSTTQLLKGNKF